MKKIEITVKKYFRIPQEFLNSDFKLQRVVGILTKYLHLASKCQSQVDICFPGLWLP